MKYEYDSKADLNERPKPKKYEFQVSEKHDQNILIAKHAHLGNEIRYAKDTKWHSTYYTVLLYFAIIAIYHWAKPPDFVVGFSYVVVVVTLLFNIIMQLVDYPRSLRMNRCQITEIEYLLGDWNGRLAEICKTKPYDPAWSRRRDWAYTIMFLIVLLAAAIGAAITIYEATQ